MAGRRRGRSGTFNQARLSGGLHPGGPRRALLRGGAPLVGSAALGNTFTYDGVDAPVEFRFDGNDFADPWTGAAGNAELASVSGTPSVTTGPDPFGGTGPSFTGNGASAGEYYQEAGNTVGDISTEDFIIEMIIRLPALAGSGGICSSQRHPSIDHGWVARHSATLLIMGVRDSSPAAVNLTINRSSLVDGEWNHVVFAFDRSGNAVAWSGVGGALGPQAVSAIGDLSTVLPLTIGDYSGISHAKGYFDTAHVAMYKPANLDLSSSTDLIAACEARYALLGGTPGSTLGA